MEIQHAAESRPADELAARSILVRRALGHLSTECLMELLPMIVHHELPDHVAQVPFTEEHEVVETLVLASLGQDVREVGFA
jgi:hypothetical protein